MTQMDWASTAPRSTRYFVGIAFLLQKIAEQHPSGIAPEGVVLSGVGHQVEGHHVMMAVSGFPKVI